MKLSLGDTSSVIAVGLIATLLGTATAHSWPHETRRLAPNGTFIGSLGFERNHPPDNVGNDHTRQWQLPTAGNNRISATDKIARDGQLALTDSTYTSQFPKLKVAPGDFAAILYRENGHVTRPDTLTPTKPVNRGTIYLYATLNNDLSNFNFLDTHLKWTADGQGGNKKGWLLATRNFDDGQCHETLPATGDPEGISTFRTAQITNTEAVACQSDIQIPENLEVGKTLTVIWVWDWPTMNMSGVAVSPATTEVGNPDGLDKPYVTIPEVYTGVVDFDIVDPCDESLGEVKGPTCKNTNGKIVGGYDIKQAATTRGISAQMKEPFLVRVPQAGFSVTAATADPTNIPMFPLIKTSFPLPLPNSVLEVQNQFFATAAPSPSNQLTTLISSSASANPAPTSTGNKKGGIVTVTVTVPEATATVTVTQHRSSGSAETTSTALPSVTTFVKDAHARREYYRR